MSAFYAVAYEDHIELITDGAVYNEDGVLMDIQRKVYTSDRLPLAVTGRGSSALVSAFAAAITIQAVVGTFDEVMERVDTLLQGLSEKGTPQDIEMVICGISESRGPVIYYFATANIHGFDDFQPWRLHQWDKECGGGNPLTEEESAGLADAFQSGGLVGVAIPLFEAMRRKKGVNPANPNLPHLYGIGGHIDWTLVSRNLTETRCIHVWPDIIGEPIDPERTEKPQWLTGDEAIAAAREWDALKAGQPSVDDEPLEIVKITA